MYSWDYSLVKKHQMSVSRKEEGPLLASVLRFALPSSVPALGWARQCTIAHFDINRHHRHTTSEQQARCGKLQRVTELS